MNHLDTLVPQFDRVIPRPGVESDNVARMVAMGESLHSVSHKNDVDRMKESSDPAEVQFIKLNLLPCIMPSCVSPNRLPGTPTGYVCLDFDGKMNPSISDWIGFVQRLKVVPYIVFAGLSASGNGAFAIVAVMFPDRHTDHYRALIEDFARYGITADKSCSNLNRLRIYSFNDYSTSFTNPTAEKYKRLSVQMPVKVYKSKPTGTDARKVQKTVAKIVADRVDLTEDYDTWMRIGMSLASSFGNGGRDWFHRISQFHKATKDHAAYDFDKTEKKYTSFLKGYERVTLGTFFMLCSSSRKRTLKAKYQ